MVKQNINIMNWAQQGFAEPLTDYIAKDNYDPVSYTHLDVYKRQLSAPPLTSHADPAAPCR